MRITKVAGEQPKGFISGNQLKIIALVAMTCDHMGKQLFPQIGWLQIVGRLAFPIFAYMIAEGCAYTKNRKKYLAQMAILGFLCQVVYFIAMGSLYQSVLVAFSLAIVLIYAIDYARTRRDIWGGYVAVTAFGLVWFVSVGLPFILDRTDYSIDYGFTGILLIVGIYLAKGRVWKWIVATVFLIVLSMNLGGIQWYSLMALPLLALYSGQRGKGGMKHLFYVYYPLHLACIYGLSLLL